MSRASEELFDRLHLLTVETLLAEIDGYRNAGEPVPPALLAQAIKLLKENGIDSPARAQEVADRLAADMPDLGPEDVVTGVPH